MRIVLAALLVVPGCLLADGGDDYPDDTSVVLVTDACPGPQAIVESVTYEGTDMTVVASYGGCGATRLWACWDGRYATSDPAQTRIDIHHEPAGNCDALLTSQLTFSLVPMVDGVGPLQRVRITVGGIPVDWQR
ncbi:MAG: hypothetical protein K8M05_38440 [Deltaproteobacteria bacterium]|nr:hypothetical protein [Kofleriaceae bacterium]